MDELERAVIEAAKAFVLERGLISVRGRGDMFDRLCDAVDALNLSAQAEVREVDAPTIEEIGGSDPDFTGDLSSEEYVRRMRDGEPAVEVGHGETPPEGYFACPGCGLLNGAHRIACPVVMTTNSRG